MKKFYALLIILIMSMSLIPVSVSAATTLNIGDTVTLYTSDAYPSYSPSGGVSRSYMWSTSNSNVIRIVSRSGNMCVVQAVGAGTAYVEWSGNVKYGFISHFYDVCEATDGYVVTGYWIDEAPNGIIV